MKYQSDLCTINDCPPKNCQSVQREAYRFVFNPICAKSFVPQGKKQPQRISNTTNDSIRCSLLGLSMFISEEKALARYKTLKKQHKNINKTIGTHLAKGVIEPQHGIVTKPNKEGHYDLFESQNIDLCSDFKIVVDLSGV